MKLGKLIVLAGCVLAVGAGAAFAGINSKEVGALLIYPEYWATSAAEPGSSVQMDTYVTITNDFSFAVIAHIEIIGGVACDDCNFDLPLTGYETKRLRLSRENVGNVWVTRVSDASPHSSTGTPAILAACGEPHGFIVAALEFEDPRGRFTIGANLLHGDEVVVDLQNGSASQVGAVAVQGVGPNSGDRIYSFNNLEYAAFPSIVTANFWAPNARVDPRLILFNVNFNTNNPVPPVTTCSLNYVNANEIRFSRNFSFGCWSDSRLLDIAAGFHEDILGTANGFLWAQCSPGTHGAILTRLSGGTQNYPYPSNADFKDTLFQSVTTDGRATLYLTPFVVDNPPPPEP